jgi:DNA polymerase I-like protein with 3'-5' exonuclease and polymerase domains
MEGVMEGLVELRVPFHVKVSVGRSWGELEEYRTA